MINDPLARFDNVKGYGSSFKDYLDALPTQEEKDQAIEQLRVFVQEPGGPYDDSFFPKIPQENIDECLRHLGLRPKSDQKLASSKD